MPITLDYPTITSICAKVHRMITMHARPRQRTNIMAIAQRFILTNASHAKNK